MRPDHTVKISVIEYEMGASRRAVLTMLSAFGVRRVRAWRRGYGWRASGERWDEAGVERVCELWVRMREQAEHYGRGLRETVSYHETGGRDGLE